jgi:hypothetical protein
MILYIIGSDRSETELFTLASLEYNNKATCQYMCFHENRYNLGQGLYNGVQNIIKELRLCMHDYRMDLF